jgi:acyl-CoA dehydrogenase
VTEGAIMMNTVARAAAALRRCRRCRSTCSRRTDRRAGHAGAKQRMLRPLISGAERTCFGVTEPNAGLNTTQIKTFARRVDGGYVVNGQQDLGRHCAGRGQHPAAHAHDGVRGECQADRRHDDLLSRSSIAAASRCGRIPKMGRAAVDSNSIFIEDLFIPDQDRIGGGGQGLLLPAAQPESGTDHRSRRCDWHRAGRAARAAAYARDRVVFGRPIGQNQSIQHPLAENWCQIEAAWLTTMKAASLYDRKQPCGSYANAAKLLAWRAAFDAATQAVLTHWRHGLRQGVPGRASVPRIDPAALAPITEQLIPLVHRREGTRHAQSY